MTPEELAENERIYNKELAKAQSVECIPHEAQVAASQRIAAPVPVPKAPEPVEALERPARFFVTGHPGAIHTLLDTAAPSLQVASLSVTVADCLRATCQLSGNPPPAVLTEFRKFGDGEFTPSLINLFMLGLVRQTWPEFGRPGFWVGAVLGSGPQAVVSVRTATEFKLLQAAGFKHYHVMATPGAVQRRTPKDYNGSLSQLSQQLDSDTHKNISALRAGPRLNVIWNDEAAPPSGRFIPAAEFQESVLGAAPVVVGSEPVSQLL